jgi:sugar-specific transcriptional regulator TrmB
MESFLNPEDLADYGLTNYEAKVYYAILPLGASTAKEISDISKIPFGRIYDTLTRLEEKGIIESQDTRPKKYIAKDPRTAMKILIEAKDRDLVRIKDAAPTIEEKLIQLYNDSSNESLFWNVAIESESITRHNQKILETQEELLIYFNAPSVLATHIQNEVKFFIESIKEIRSRDAKVKLLFGGVNEEELLKNVSQFSIDLLELLKEVEIRFTSVITNTFDVIDKEKVIIKIINPVNETEYLALIYLWQHSFASKMREKFLQLWDGAKIPKLKIQIN